MWKIVKFISGAAVVAFIIGVAIIDSALVPGVILIGAAMAWLVYVTRAWSF